MIFQMFSMYGAILIYVSLCVLLPCRGRSGRAMVLGKLPVPGHPTNLDCSMTRPTALAVGAGGAGLDFFLWSITSLFFLPLFGRQPDID